MPDTHPPMVGQIDKAILRVIGRLTYGTWITSGESRVPAAFHRGVPLAFLCIEFWRLVMDGEKGGTFVWDRVLESLERRKLVDVRSTILFVPNGIYTDSQRQEWVVEQRHEEIPIHAGEICVGLRPVPKLYCYLQSSGADAFRELEREPLGAVNLYSPAGMRLDVNAHHHYLLSEEGWGVADLPMSDFIDDCTLKQDCSRDATQQKRTSGSQSVDSELDDRISAGEGERKEQSIVLSGESRALAILTDHPEWTDERIAKAAGLNRTTLYDYPTYKKFRALLKEKRQRTGRRRGRTGKPMADTLPDSEADNLD